MSDAPPVAVPPHAEPLDLSKFQSPEKPAAVEPDLRRLMLYLGLTVHSQLVRTGKLPEDIAASVGLDETQMDAVMLGRKSDVGIDVLFRLSKAIGAQLQMQMAVTQEPPKPV